MLREKDEVIASVSGEARERESRDQRVRVVLWRECWIRGDESCKLTVELSKL